MNEVKPWLETAGKFTVEHVPCPHFSEPVNLAGPRTGVIHTTEGGSIDGAMSVFRQHFAPHFVVGQGRILQLVRAWATFCTRRDGWPRLTFSGLVRPALWPLALHPTLRGALSGFNRFSTLMARISAWTETSGTKRSRRSCPIWPKTMTPDLPTPLPAELDLSGIAIFDLAVVATAFVVLAYFDWRTRDMD